VRTFVDRQTGAIEHVPADAEVEGVFDDIFASPERWIQVQPLATRVRNELRHRYVDAVDDPQFRLRLADALAGELPLVRFATVLREGPGLLDGWLLFRERELESVARAWLAAIGIDAVAPETVHPLFSPPRS
jgi:hypothetical protein